MPPLRFCFFLGPSRSAVPASRSASAALLEVLVELLVVERALVGALPLDSRP